MGSGVVLMKETEKALLLIFIAPILLHKLPQVKSTVLGMFGKIETHEPPYGIQRTVTTRFAN